MHSLEHGKAFHLARRILKAVNPSFRLLATDSLDADQVVLDLASKTIEVSEKTEEIKAVASILFQIGHLTLLDREDLSEHSGQIDSAIGEKRIVARLIAQGMKADQLASAWAKQVFLANWPAYTHQEADELIGRYVWTEAEWVSYYG